MWQDIAVGIVGIIVCIYLLWKVYAFIMRPTQAGDKCSGCTGCALKDELKATKTCPSAQDSIHSGKNISKE